MAAAHWAVPAKAVISCASLFALALCNQRRLREGKEGREEIQKLKCFQLMVAIYNYVVD